MFPVTEGPVTEYLLYNYFTMFHFELLSIPSFRVLFPLTVDNKPEPEQAAVVCSAAAVVLPHLKLKQVNKNILLDTYSTQRLSRI